MNTKTTSLDPEQMQHAARVLKTLGHPTRLAIIETLEEGERNVTDIQETIGEPQAITSQHLRLMESREILTSRRDGVQVYYDLKNKFITQILECIKGCGRKL
ncbi:MAG: metalloregulator ArsR/SmtB family transcription factor [Candidatus Marinimicrobia bacterium]|nr:metalloregulator ArsR/SmtB family transcription factor [Candidatus Neomarinimicrobiota bacterium]MCF7827980.1 metalloregulator ArsR/SmtB family transcription factor [Candidatus Neomarinimicrobiota bacterium]MCF7879265.1 metalloregulator ArsR/SmtB family transcription factor [Candidatus Neomarinimicrobiota bacterium]